MQNVCTACHSDSVILGHYNQFDKVVDLYNDKFAKPIAAIMDDLHKSGTISLKLRTTIRSNGFGGRSGIMKAVEHDMAHP